MQKLFILLIGLTIALLGDVSQAEIRLDKNLNTEFKKGQLISYRDYLGALCQERCNDKLYRGFAAIVDKSILSLDDMYLGAIKADSEIKKMYKRAKEADVLIVRSRQSLQKLVLKLREKILPVLEKGSAKQEIVVETEFLKSLLEISQSYDKNLIDYFQYVFNSEMEEFFQERLNLMMHGKKPSYVEVITSLCNQRYKNVPDPSSKKNKIDKCNLNMRELWALQTLLTEILEQFGQGIAESKITLTGNARQRLNKIRETPEKK